MKRKGDYIRTFSGIDFWPLDPRPSEVNVVDIAHALSNVCRFGGHCVAFYSVAQHSVHVSDLIWQFTKNKSDALCGLFHDAPEAYIGDMVSPLKKHLPSFKRIDARIWKAVAKRFNLAEKIPHIVHTADTVSILTEARDIINGSVAWLEEKPYCFYEPATETIRPVNPVIAEAEFILRYERLKP